jgi:hypothetical protein
MPDSKNYKKIIKSLIYNRSTKKLFSNLPYILQEKACYSYALLLLVISYVRLQQSQLVFFKKNSKSDFSTVGLTSNRGHK